VAQRLEDRGRVSGLKEGIKEGIKEGRKEGIKEGGLIMLYRLASEGTITIDQAVNAALPYGVKNAEDFRKRAMLAGYNLK
jgi:flagellar biosynthesis/type III secretory pathway protein FliH